MASEKIKSSTIEAQSAISELIGLDVSEKANKQVKFSYSSGIVGMENGKKVTNQMLEAVGNFSEAVLIQANKFPQIAEKIEKRDVEQAQRWRS
ncbi:TIGR04197 family type VII secretion effector [Streptococcus sp. A12]|uniref:TIGR04197 family type VII secretion effector n=1 Tax=Streptococcus sp. A12 TaxID=1759399 RepID=UPI002600C4B8|nr:TIGR04197 family type VII secretion effector [Streptococcus sp. A12]